jgi:thioredoxin 1
MTSTTSSTDLAHHLQDDYIELFFITLIKVLTMEVTITTENFESLKNGELPLVVDFWATWCGPCRMIAPYIAQLAEEYDGKIVVGKCDVEENDDIAMEFGIRNIPTILFIKDGKVVDKHVGAATKAKLQEKFEKLL